MDLQLRGKLGLAEVRGRADRFIDHDCSVVKDFLELGRRCRALMRRQVRLPAHVKG